MRDETRLGELLREVLGEERYRELDNLRELRDSWGDLVGEEAGERSWPLLIKRGKLMVGTASPSWCSEIFLRKAEIKKKIREKTGIELEDILVRTQY